MGYLYQQRVFLFLFIISLLFLVYSSHFSSPKLIKVQLMGVNRNMSSQSEEILTPTQTKAMYKNDSIRPIFNSTVFIHGAQNHSVLKATSTSFGKLVHFGPKGREFDFRINIDVKPSTCATSIQKKFQGSKWASNMFLRNITMVMHQGAMSNAEYKRLHAFGMPYGLKGYKRSDLSYKDLQAILSKLPHEYSILDFSSKEKPTCLSCAVIGNGGILNGSKLGKEIDGHDLVFRVNHAIRRGFEEDVGNKTTHYVMMDRSLIHTSKEDVPRDKEIKYVFLPCRRLDYSYIKDAIGRPNPKLKLVTDANNVRILHPDFVRYINKIWIRRKRFFRPTTGGIMFMSALHCGCDSVDVYGMGINKQYSAHYYDLEHQRYKYNRGHDFGREVEILKALDNEGIINWYKRDVNLFK
ncbi:alpha-N-acetylgalactosaminide alpha-2,6-sialyltransferase 1-like isoform X2 [Antedon mediterranea]